MSKAMEAAARAIFAQRYQSGEYVFGGYLPGTEFSRSEAQAAVTAYLAAREAEGFVMVPVEPTPEMLDAFVSRALQVSIHGEGGWSEYGRNQWQQMLAARPTEGGWGHYCRIV